MPLFNVIRPESKKRFDSEHTLVGQYLENNCVDDPVKLCDFQLLENRIMKTVDSVYQVTSRFRFSPRQAEIALSSLITMSSLTAVYNE